LGLFTNLFGKARTWFYYNFGSSGSITAFDKTAYEHELVRAVIDAIASNAAKAEAMHVIIDDKGRVREIKRGSPYARLLNSAPNPLMTGYDFKYRLFSQQEQYTTSYCYIGWDGTRPDMLLPVDYAAAKIIKPKYGPGYLMEFSMPDGQQVTVDLEDVVILRKLYGNGEVMGDGNAPIENTLNMIKAADDALMKAMSISNRVRGVFKLKKPMLSPEDKLKQSELFSEQFNSAASKGGFITTDATEDYQQLNAQTLTANALQMQEIKKNLFRYWHVSDAIITGDYSDTQYQAFFESVIEPRLTAAAQAFTNGFFTKREQAAGNRILFNSSTLMHASVSTKINLLREARETGLFTINEQRELFGYPPVEGGDERQVSLNYVKGNDQSVYQTGKEDNSDVPAEGDEDGQEQTD